MVENRQPSDTAAADLDEACARSSSRVARWILDVLLGEKLELTIGSRRFRLTQERAYRLEALDKALAQFGPGSFLFKVGDKAVGRWRGSRG